jgi:hypothetical protein
MVYEATVEIQIRDVTNKYADNRRDHSRTSASLVVVQRHSSISVIHRFDNGNRGLRDSKRKIIQVFVITASYLLCNCNTYKTR